jgi:anti-sigma factor RsiW
MTMPETDDRMLLHAALDGELDAAGMIGIERRLAFDQVLSAEYARLKALRTVISAYAAREPAPDRLRMQVMSELGLAGSTGWRPAHRLSINWRALVAPRVLAASVAFAVVIAAGAYALWPIASSSDDVTRALVAGYMRAQISGRPIDVASSDRHTVKPWLAGKAPLATSVPDLAAEGFPLAGARIDIVAGAAVPTLVYQRREHFVSVTELASGAVKYPKTVRSTMIEGYSVLVWDDGQRAYTAISDMPLAELESFVVALRRAVARDREETDPRPP